MEKTETIDLLKKHVKTTPRILFNIGVGPKPHCECIDFKKLWPSIRIVGLEPNIDTFIDRLVDYPGELYPWAIWSTPCVKALRSVIRFPGRSSLLDSRSEWNKEPNFQFQNAYKEVLVSCITLDQLDKVLGFPEDIFLWMDIEGSELEALFGGCSLLASGRVKWIDMEIGHKARKIDEPNENSIEEFLRTYGFHLECKYNSGTVFHNSLYVRV